MGLLSDIKKFSTIMEQLRKEVQAANAAYGETLNRSNRMYVHETVDSAVLKEREDTEEKDMMNMVETYNEDCRMSVSEVTEAETYRVGCQYPDVFIAQSLASDNDQDRFQRQDNSNWEVKNVEFKKSIRSRRPRLTPTRGWPLREICWMQRLAWRHSPRRDPAPAIKANAKKIGNRQDTVRSRPAPSLREICWMQRLAGLCSPRRDPGLIFRIGPGPDYLGGHFFGV